MRSNLVILMFFLVLLTACTQKADAEFLIGGNWVATAGYEDGEIEGEPNCHFFEVGLEFKTEEIVYNADFDEDFEYRLSFRNKITEITFFTKGNGVFSYNVYVISDNEMGFEGVVGSFEGKSCYLERK